MTTPTSVAAKIGVPTDDAEIQPYPTTGQLVANLNPSYSDLLRDVGSERGNVYCYIVDSVEVSTDGWFEHHGSGPNFQGDRITLCTCKHLMRTFQDADQWEGTWVAGFTGINAVGDRRHYLVYLMRIRCSVRIATRTMELATPGDAETKSCASEPPRRHLRALGAAERPVRSQALHPAAYRSRPLLEQQLAWRR